MSVGATEEQEMLKSSARRFFEQECGESYVREMEDHKTGWSADKWKKMADLGWFALMIPETHGGAGLSLADLTVIVSEAGRALLPGPFVSNQTVVGLLNTCANDAQKTKYFPGIAGGTSVHTVAFTERQGRWGENDIALEIESKGGEAIVSGAKRFVPYARGADVIWVIARGKSGLVAVPVARDSKGITIEPLSTISSDHQADVKLDGVRVSDADIVALNSYNQLADPALVMECAWLCGLAEMDFDITLEYAKQRQQFGKSIAAFQVIQHKFADMATDLETMRGITEQAALAVRDGAEASSLIASIAKAWCSEASRRIVAHGQQIHGGIGFTMEYKIQLYFRRQKRAEFFWGDADFHRGIVKESLGI